MSVTSITSATSDDALGIQEVFYKTWLDTYPNNEAGITVEDIEDMFKNAFTEETIQKRKEQIRNPKDGVIMLIAKDGSKVVGLCVLVKREDKNQLQAIYVLPEYQGKRIGSLFWEEAIKIFGLSKDIIVEVATFNDKAISFYKKLGFKDTGKRFSNEKFRMKSGSIIPEMEMILKAV